MRWQQRVSSSLLHSIRSTNSREAYDVPAHHPQSHGPGRQRNQLRLPALRRARPRARRLPPALPGNLDGWDPALVDDIAAEREVILFDASGVGLSTGSVPANFEQSGRDALAFIDALGLTEVDLFGFSIGGFVAQEVALQRPTWCAGWSSPAPAPEAAGTCTAGPPSPGRTP